ncbi:MULTISPECIES: hypothetical protein [unclassified Streptomyces]|uniref:Uncharacterized protein n=1 Tax=Streptomyces lonegramiae TaxID=3075524 RepID=A0ABU2XA00_9ACTN|nr:hypothetical protein [Streptomyces sp. DSM 41529]MDT0542733.1 hypothetical protein [Streptomyces sp. DSM 41529]
MLDEGEDDGPAPVDAAALAARHVGSGPVRTTAQRAAADRSSAYGHVIKGETAVGARSGSRSTAAPRRR